MKQSNLLKIVILQDEIIKIKQLTIDECAKILDLWEAGVSKNDSRLDVIYDRISELRDKNNAIRGKLDLITNGL